MAGWAVDPRAGQAPGCAGYEERFWRAVDDDLDTPAALAVLHELEGDESLPPAARFASVAAFDHFLGLDLAAEVGQALPDGATELIAAREQARAAATSPPPTASATSWPPWGSRSPTPGPGPPGACAPCRPGGGLLAIQDLRILTDGGGPAGGGGREGGGHGQAAPPSRQRTAMSWSPWESSTAAVPPRTAGRATARPAADRRRRTVTGATAPPGRRRGRSARVADSAAASERDRRPSRASQRCAAARPGCG